MHVMKEYRRSGDVAPLILTLSTRWRRSESRSGRSTSGKGPGYSLNRRLGVPESIWTFWIRLKKKNLLFLPGIEPQIAWHVA